MLHRSMFIAFCAILFISTTACTPSPTTGAPTNSPSGDSYPGIGEGSSDPYPYPAADESLYSPYPGADLPEEPQVHQPEPTYDVNLGIIRGKIVINGEPGANRILYLADVLKSDTGTEMATSFDPQNSARTTCDQDGNFAFINIQPNRYGLVLYLIHASYLLPVPNSEEPLLFSAESGKTTDLGTLEYEGLSLPNNE